jgi:hypothetical protein
MNMTVLGSVLCHLNRLRFCSGRCPTESEEWEAEEEEAAAKEKGLGEIWKESAAKCLSK